MIFYLYQDVTAEEFEVCMSILAATKLGVTITGHSELVALAIEQAEINVDVDPVLVEDELVERFIQCATHALPYFSVSFDASHGLFSFIQNCHKDNSFHFIHLSLFSHKLKPLHLLSSHARNFSH